MKKDIIEIEKLFEQLYNLTKIENIAIHEFINGELNPVHMRKNDKVSVEKWKEEHSKSHVKIAEDKYLIKISNCEFVAIENADTIEDCPDEFKLFNIKSNYIIPLIKDNKSVGMVLMASIGQAVELNKETKEKCIMLVKEYSKNI